MSAEYETVRHMLSAHNRLQNAIDSSADVMVDLLLKSDLSGVHGYKLALLKMRLRRFNAHTQKWAE